MTTVYRFLAESTAAFHVLFVFFVVFGGLLVLWLPRLAWIHLPSVTWGFIVNSTALSCPLTPFENHLRLAAGLAAYRGGFIESRILSLLYPGGITRTVQVLLVLCAVLLNVSVYLATWQRRREAKRASFLTRDGVAEVEAQRS